jgi:adenylyltransferase/sulfurtransferase
VLLTREELERYARHIILPEIGGGGQQRLKAAKVLVVGAGGLGAPLLLYLAAAGIGTIGIVDDDRVSLSNLQRQVIHSSHDVGRMKTESAAMALERLNPHTKIVQIATRIDGANAESLLCDYDVVADGSDNFATRYVVSDACYRVGRPLVTAMLGRFDATLTTIRAHEKAIDGRPNPTFRCLFPNEPPAGTIPNCAEAGILGAIAGMAGAMMAVEVIRAIVPFGTPLVGRYLMIDAADLRFDTISYDWDPENPLSGHSAR